MGSKEGIWLATVSIYKSSQIDIKMLQMSLEIIKKILKLLSLGGYLSFVCFTPQSIYSPLSS